MRKLAEQSSRDYKDKNGSMEEAAVEQQEEEATNSMNMEETVTGEVPEENAETMEDSAENEAESRAEDMSTESGEADGMEAADSKSFFKKKAKGDKKQEALKQKIEELEDRVKRQMAEFDNFRKRTEKEKTAMFETGAKSVIEKILPVVDNFERGLATVSEEDKGSGFADGMQMIYKQLMTELDNLGVKPIEAVGQEFNPEFHNAVMQVESEEYESGIVAQELQKGYMYRDSVVRHSMVAVVS